MESQNGLSMAFHWGDKLHMNSGDDLSLAFHWGCRFLIRNPLLVIVSVEFVGIFIVHVTRLTHK